MRYFIEFSNNPALGFSFDSELSLDNLDNQNLLTEELSEKTLRYLAEEGVFKDSPDFLYTLLALEVFTLKDNLSEPNFLREPLVSRLLFQAIMKNLNFPHTHPVK